MAESRASERFGRTSVMIGGHSRRLAHNHHRGQAALARPTEASAHSCSRAEARLSAGRPPHYRKGRPSTAQTIRAQTAPFPAASERVARQGPDEWASSDATAWSFATETLARPQEQQCGVCRAQCRRVEEHGVPDPWWT